MTATSLLVYECKLVSLSTCICMVYYMNNEKDAEYIMEPFMILQVQKPLYNPAPTTCVMV